MLDPSEVTACLVTRGNVEMGPIIETLPFEKVVIYDNSKEYADLKVFGRYEATKRTSTFVVAWQDDDVIVPRETWEALLEAYDPREPCFVSNNAHGPNHGGYNDLALQAAGALCPVSFVADAWARWFQRYPIELAYAARALQEDGVKMPVKGSAGFIYGVLYEADFIFGVLCNRWKQLDLPYTRLYADDDTRLCRQPWQEEVKLKMTNLARAIRDS